MDDVLLAYGVIPHIISPYVEKKTGQGKANMVVLLTCGQCCKLASNLNFYMTRVQEKHK